MLTPRLWTPIANALEAYRRRVVIDPKAEYEHIWRLIHIQEALAVSLASLLATRLANLLDDTRDRDTTNALRGALTGLQPDVDDDDDGVEPSAWGGSIDSWIQLLRRFGKVAIKAEDPFLTALADYLSSTPNRPLAFADAWMRIAPVPATFRDPVLDRVGRLGAINSFRNKLAHVPVPQRVLGELHRGLRVEVLDGLTEKFNPETDATSPGFIATSYREPLVGILYCGSAYLTGASEVGIDVARNPNATELEASYRKGSTAINWPVTPFFRIDGEAKAALLFRVTDLQREPGATGYGGEYHRFAAELEPVTYATIPVNVIAPWLPQATPSASSAALRTQEDEPAAEVQKSAGPSESSGEEVTPNTSELRRLAEEAFSHRNYGSAAKLFDALAERNETLQYNDVARSKHGAALWRAAARNASGDDLQRSLEKAVALLRGAERHRDLRYSARSAYEGSKALWHLWHATGENKHLLAALDAAERAVSKSPDEAFLSWQARVKADVDIAFPHGVSDSSTVLAKPDEKSLATVEGRADDFCRLSGIHGSCGRYLEAIEAANNAINLCPTHIGAWKSLAVNLSQMGKHDQARQAWQRVDELENKAPVDYKSAADRELLNVRANWASPDAWEKFARVYDQEQRGEEAIAEARQALANYPEAHASVLPLVEWFASSLPAASLGLLEKMCTIEPDNHYYIHLSGVAKRKTGRNEQALQDLRLACEKRPMESKYWYALGRCFEDLGNTTAAREALTKAVTCSVYPHSKAQERLKNLDAHGMPSAVQPESTSENNKEDLL